MLDAPASTNALAEELRAATSRLRTAIDSAGMSVAPVGQQVSCELSTIEHLADQIAVVVSSDPMHARVLVVDDTEVNRTVLVSQLQRCGVDSATAANGAEALDQLESDSFDLVLMDWHMPEVDGLEALVLHRTRCIQADIEPTPVIMVTADASDESRQRCLDAGATDFLAKPVSLSTLRASIVGVLGEHMLAPDPSARPAAPPTAGLVDRQVIDQMVDDLGGADPVQRVIDAFVADSDERLNAVSAGQAGGDTAEARRASHTLKSTAALLGARDLSAASKRLEVIFDVDERPDDAALAEFTKLFHATLDDLRAIRDGLTDA